MAFIHPVRAETRCDIHVRGANRLLTMLREAGEAEVISRMEKVSLQKKAPLSQSLEPVKHLSSSFQRKLLKRVDKQCKQFRSSGKPYPLVQSPSLTTENQMQGFTLLLILAQLD